MSGIDPSANTPEPQNPPQAAGGFPPPPPPGQPSAGAQRSANGLAITSLVLGIVGIVGSCLTGAIALVLGILAIIFGAIALKQIRDRGQSGRGLALAGLILGIVVAGWGLLALLVLGGMMLSQIPNM